VVASVVKTVAANLGITVPSDARPSNLQTEQVTTISHLNNGFHGARIVASTNCGAPPATGNVRSVIYGTVSSLVPTVRYGTYRHRAGAS
jgi:hypothetical protein